MSVGRLELRSNLRDYSAVFESDSSFLNQYVNAPHRVFVVDETVWRLHSAGALAALPEEDVFVLPIAESLKTLSSVQAVWDRLLENPAKRNLTLVAIGGGICQDITGFAASTLYRGIKWVFVPTTLLAQCDSCIGSKTSLNYERFKNLLGTFYPPTAVHIYAPFLDTQQDGDYYSGLGELAKLHVMGGRDDAEWFDSHSTALRVRDKDVLGEAVMRALAIKRDFIEGDEFDLGRRNLLNYGHCFGHAIEAATHFAVPHGQAVVLGMIAAQHVVRARGVETDAAQRSLLDRLFRSVLHPETDLGSLDISVAIEAMKHDKKRMGDGLVLVACRDGFEMLRMDDLSVDEARQALSALIEG